MQEEQRPALKRKRVDEEESEVAIGQEDINTKKQIVDAPPSPTRLQFLRQVVALKNEIRKKEEWERKIKDPMIRARFIEEAIEQGASEKAINTALEEMELFECKSEVRFEFESVISDLAILHSDNLVPADLQKRVEEHLDVLANKPDKDWHPGSENLVLDLIHPSLYPYIRGVSRKSPKPKNEGDENNKEEVEGEEEEAEEEEYDRWGRFVETSKYQWLPAIYSVDKNNKVKITSYINNLDEKEHPEIYRDCEEVFECMLEYIEKCIYRAENIRFSPHYRTWNDLSLKKEEEHIAEVPEKLRRYQVITKACNYVLPPGAVYSGNWHVEGMSHERILVSGLYYYASSPGIEDSGLAFRAESGYSEDYGPSGEREWEGNVNLGRIRTPAGRCIIFSNEFQHCVTMLENPTEETVSRKILCFFVVDPSRPIVSSEIVPPQQWDWNKKRIIFELLLVTRFGLGLNIPKELIVHIAEYCKMPYWFSKEEAEQHRLALMEERQPIIDSMNSEWERTYSLCEH